jgi:EmrB/QacA subfamily drug resistance transporter
MNEANDAASKIWVLVLTSVASLMVALDAMVVSTALSESGREFGASIESLEWTVNAYTISFAVLLMTAAVMGDRFGRRRLFAAGLGLFVAASAACALAPNIGWLIAARAVQGVGAAAVMPLALAQLSAAFPPERRGWALGIYSSVTALSSVVGPVVGGAITQGLAWQWIFWLNVPIGLLVVVLTFSRLRETFGPGTAADISGLALATGGVLSVVWGLVRANAVGWGSPEILASLAAGALLVALFVAWELRCAAPMIPMRLFRLRAFAAGNAAMFLLNGALMSAIFFMAQFQQIALGQGPLAAGLRLLPWGIALVIVAPKAGALAERLGESSVVVLSAWPGSRSSPGPDWSMPR